MRNYVLVLIALVASVALFGCLTQPTKQGPVPEQNVTGNITGNVTPSIPSALSEYSDFLNDTLDQALIDLDDVS